MADKGEATDEEIPVAQPTPKKRRRPNRVTLNRAEQTAKWRELVAAAEFDKIRVKVDNEFHPIRSNQQAELRQWLSGSWDEDWLVVRAGVPASFIAQVVIAALTVCCLVWLCTGWRSDEARVVTRPCS